MQTRVVIAVLTGASLLLAGCLPLRRSVEARYGSLKDDAPSATASHTREPRAAALPPPAPSAVPPPAAPAVAAPPAPPRPRGSQDITADDRTREEQLAPAAGGQEIGQQFIGRQPIGALAVGEEKVVNGAKPR